MPERLPPHWLDDVIDSVWLKDREKSIASAIANSPQLAAAIEQGIAEANRANPHDKGPSHAQFIRQAIVNRINSPT